MAEIRTQPLFTIRLRTDPPQNIGRTPMGQRMVVPVVSGTFEGARLRGTVEKSGSDWIFQRADGALALDVRLVLKTGDGALIGLTYRGFRHGPAETIARLGRGEPVDPSEYYFRTAVFFETAADQYDWLNRVVAIGTGHRLPEGPVYEVFEVL